MQGMSCYIVLIFECAQNMEIGMTDILHLYVRSPELHPLFA